MSLILQVHLFFPPDSSLVLLFSFSPSEWRPGSATRVIICLQLVLCENHRRRSPIRVSGVRHKLKINPILLFIFFCVFFFQFFCLRRSHNQRALPGPEENQPRGEGRGSRSQHGAGMTITHCVPCALNAPSASFIFQASRFVLLLFTLLVLSST